MTLVVGSHEMVKLAQRHRLTRAVYDQSARSHHVVVVDPLRRVVDAQIVLLQLADVGDEQRIVTAVVIIGAGNDAELAAGIHVHPVLVAVQVAQLALYSPHSLPRVVHALEEDGILVRSLHRLHGQHVGTKEIHLIVRALPQLSEQIFRAFVIHALIGYKSQVEKRHLVVSARAVEHLLCQSLRLCHVAVALLIGAPIHLPHRLVRGCVGSPSAGSAT